MMETMRPNKYQNNLCQKFPKRTAQIGWMFILLLSMGVSQAARSQFIVKAQIRPRTEVRHGYGTLASRSDRTAVFTSQRSRLLLQYVRPDYRIGLSLQDIRVWGDEEQLKDVASAAVHEAWAEIFFSKNLSVKLGRQELVYDDHRLLGNVNWAQQARSHDAAVLKWHRNGWQADVGAAYNNQKATLFRTVFPLNSYKSLFYMWIHRDFKNGWRASFSAITDGYQRRNISKYDVVYRYTFGPYLQYAVSQFHFSGTFYYQAGTDNLGRDIRAYMFSVTGNYHRDHTWLNAGVDYLSGTDALDAGNRRNHSFNTLYATNHKFYGFMDYFLNIPLHTANGGLLDSYGGVKLQFRQPVSVSATYHNFRLASNVAEPANPTTPIGKGLGSEIDAVVNYNFKKDINVKAGYSVLLPTSSMQILKGGNKNVTQDWAWLMISLNSELFRAVLPN